MANKFQMSVQERLEQEVSRQKAESNQTAPKETPKLSPIEKKKSIPASKEEKDKQEQALGISDYLYPKQQRQAKNKTFYLDDAVVAAIHKVAREQGVTDSKLVNDILRRVLDV